MAKKLTKELVNYRLKDRDIELVGEYLGSHIKTIFRCYIGHIWRTKPCDVLNNKSGCPECFLEYRRLTKKQINQRLQNENRDVVLIGEYLGSATKTLFKCKQGHEQIMIPTGALRGYGCSECYATKQRLTIDDINRRLNEDGRDIRLDGKYTNSVTKTQFVCGQNHQFDARLGDIFRGQGCPSCADYGFDGNKKAFIYLLEFGTHLKYGITNSIDTRLRKHKKTGEYQIVLMVECTGHIARQWENTIKQIFGGRYVDKSVMADGWTETLSLELRSDVIDTMVILRNQNV